jgi:hypothetical protein
MLLIAFIPSGPNSASAFACADSQAGRALSGPKQASGYLSRCTHGPPAACSYKSCDDTLSFAFSA